MKDILFTTFFILIMKIYAVIELPLLLVDYLVKNPFYLLILIAILILINTYKKNIKIFINTIITILSYTIAYITGNNIKFKENIFSSKMVIDYNAIFHFVFCIIGLVSIILLIIKILKSAEKTQTNNK